MPKFTLSPPLPSSLPPFTRAYIEAAAFADALDAARNAPPSSEGDSTDSARSVDDAAAESQKAGVEGASSRQPRPPIAVGRPVEAYPAVDLVALATWVEQGTPGLTEDEAVAALATDVGVGHLTGRTDTVLRRAVRAATIAVSPRSPEPAAPPRPDAASVIDDPLPTLSGADEAERAAERPGEQAAREQWLNDERPPHH
jgi:hypothetical protein